MASLPSIQDRHLDVLSELYHADNPLLRALPGIAGAGHHYDTNPAFAGHPAQTPVPVWRYPRLRKIFGFPERDPSRSNRIGRAEAGIVGTGSGWPPEPGQPELLSETFQNDVPTEIDGYAEVRAFARTGLSAETLQEEDKANQQFNAYAATHPNAFTGGNKYSRSPFPNASNQPSSP